jgi:phosphoserine aminotransferase
MVGAGAKTIYNFCSGPAMLPTSVLERAQTELLSFNQKGISVLEMSHRSPEFLSILESAESRLRRLLSIPNNYSVLFMQGGASQQFSAIPLNLMAKYKRSGYLTSGYWSNKAINEAKKYGEVVEFSSDQLFRYDLEGVDEGIFSRLDYIHYTPNETIDGTQIFDIPETGDIPLVADMSSCILSELLNIERFGLIYAGAQKNIGPAGMAVVIVRNDLIGTAHAMTPRLLNYEAVLSENSMANTPPTFAIYLADLVFEWLEVQGGVRAISALNKAKAQLLYKALDKSELVFNNVDPSARSKMNVPFQLKRDELTSEFLSEAEKFGLFNLKGHRSAGGCRASIYNAMPLEGVQKLVEFIKIFEKKHV